MTSRMLLEYDGSAFAGWARQPGQRTVQEEVEQALRTVLRDDALALTVAGRTDSGVHAWGQVCSYEHEAVDPLRLNALLPRDVAVLDCNPAPDGFNARHDAISRTYCYRVLRRRARSVWLDGRALWHGWELDTAALEACASALPGTHDFTAFTPSDTYHTRFEREVLAAEWRVADASLGGRPDAASGCSADPPSACGSGSAAGDVLEFWITADTFMRQMNRILVGTMLEVATGRRTAEDFGALLRGARRSDAGPTAPPHGLALAAVGYPPQA